MIGFKLQPSSIVSKINIILIFQIFLAFELCPLIAQSCVKAGYYWIQTHIGYFHPSDIDSTLFTHLVCGFAGVNSSSFEVIVTSSSDKRLFSNFTDTVKVKNPSIITLLSIKYVTKNDTNFNYSMINNEYCRQNFIDSSIRLARLYGFHGLDFLWEYPDKFFDRSFLGIFFEEWRYAVSLEAKKSNQSQLILTATVNYSPRVSVHSYPIVQMQQNLDWVHIGYTSPKSTNFTDSHASLFDPRGNRSADHFIRSWIRAGFVANKLVLCLIYTGYAWTLLNSQENGIGAPVTGPALTLDGIIMYKEIKDFIERNGATVMYNATYVMNYCTINETIWIAFDDVEAVKTKASYAKEKGMLGYIAWQIPYDDNSVLSQAANEIFEYHYNHSSPPAVNNAGNKHMRLLAIISLSIIAAIIIVLALICFVIRCRIMRNLISKYWTNDSAKQLKDKINNLAAAGHINASLMAYSLADIQAATNRFSIQNYLGRGGYGLVYKGMLRDGQVIAVKKLSKTSSQGFEEFKNEVILTAKLQHVNLVKVLGFCVDREELMLIYEYMPNKSLDYYIFDLNRRQILDWEKRFKIIEGVIQGLLYLQEYSRQTIIHRDLKASNILLDKKMEPKISDFGLARIFTKEDLEASTEHIVGTYGYVPPEYVLRGIYSTKSDVYSFGVLLLQIISGKTVCVSYDEIENLGLVDYAYNLWKDGKGMDFMDSSLDDTHSSCKLMRCLQVALLCVQDIPSDRPTMLEVFSILKNEATNIMIPKKPSFFTQTNEDDLTIYMEAYSGNYDVTISEMVCT